MSSIKNIGNYTPLITYLNPDKIYPVDNLDLSIALLLDT